MEQSRYIHSQSLRFVRWCRKSYAAFCSIGHCVTIGRVSKGIIEASLPKQVNMLRLAPDCKGDDEQFLTDSSGDGGGGSEVSPALDELLSVMLMPLNASSECAAHRGHSNKIININKNNRRGLIAFGRIGISLYAIAMAVAGVCLSIKNHVNGTNGN